MDTSLCIFVVYCLVLFYSIYKMKKLQMVSLLFLLPAYVIIFIIMVMMLANFLRWIYCCFINYKICFWIDFEFKLSEYRCSMDISLR